MVVVRKSKQSALERMMSGAQRQWWSAPLRAARLRVGETGLQRLRWLLRFSSFPPDYFQHLKVSEADASNAEVFVFCLSGRFDPSIDWRVDATGRMSPFSLRPNNQLALAQEVAGHIRDLVTEGSMGFQVGEGGPVYRALYRSSFSSSYVAMWSGNIREVFLLNVVDLLQAEGGRIKRCAWEPCGKLFIKLKRGAYCSRDCSQRERTRRYQGKLGSEAWREKRHQYYVRKVERIKGKKFAEKIRRRKERRK